MNRLLNLYGQQINALNTAAPWLALLLLRLLIGWEFLDAGLEKYNGENWFSQVRDDFLFPFNLLPAEWSWSMATWFERVGGIALIVGFVCPTCSIIPLVAC